MNKIILIVIIFLTSYTKLFSDEIKLEKIINDFKRPWSFSFIGNDKILLTEKSGHIFHVNLKNKKFKKIEHNLNILEDGQGGLLEILYFDKYVYVSYSENRGNGNSSTFSCKS